MSKVLLIDGNSIMNRAFYAIPLLTNANGDYTNAVYGFLNIMMKFLDEEKPEYIGVAFDLKKPTFRHECFAEYKGNRKSMPDELRSQMPVIKELLAKMNISIFELEGYEADDILGTLAKRYDKEGMSVSLVSGDRDMLQIATDSIKIRIPKTSKGKTEVEDYYAKDVMDKYQVTPREFIDLKALMGDASDNIPGVPGIGEKTAIKIISEYKSIENAIEHIETMLPKGAAEKIKENKEQAIMSKFLATICLEVPINEPISKKENMLNEESYAMLKTLEFRSIIEKLSKDKRRAETSSATTKDEKDTVVVELVSTELKVIKESKEFKELIGALKGSKRIVFKIFEDRKAKVEQMTFLSKTEDSSIGNIYGIGLGIDNGENFLVACSKNLPAADVLSNLKTILEDKNILKTGHDIKKDMKLLKGFGNIKINNFEDLMIANYVINPTKEKYEYSDIASEFLNEYVSSYEEFFGKGKSKKSIFELDDSVALNYISTYLCTLSRARDEINRRIKENKQENLLHEIEYPLIQVLADMEYTGIKINREYLSQYSNKINSMVENLENEIYAQAGEKFNISSPKQLGEILFEKLGLPVIKKTKTGYSTDVDVLEKLSKSHDIVKHIMEYRHMSKLKSTYSDGLLDYIDRETDKIYTSYQQTVAATGRLSSTDPNLQNIPIKLEIGREIRQIFVPSTDEYTFIDADYSQIELRLLADISGDETLIRAYKEDQDIHRLTASQVLGIPFDEVTKEQRNSAKAINFGIVYGIGAFSLSQDIGVSVKEAEKYIQGYFAKYPKVKEYMDNTVEQAKQNGYVETLFGRRREIPELKSTNFMQRAFGERVAMNTPIQGTAADIMKIAMIRVANELEVKNMKSRILLQVHDEILVETHKTELEQVKDIVKRGMEQAASLKVPIDIGLGVGDNWLEAH